MGVVWRAVDTTLDREVAIKILPDAFADDRERLARFEREAKLLASLNHPGLASVFGVHDADLTRFIAMELVPGEDLAERLARGPLSISEALASSTGTSNPRTSRYRPMEGSKYSTSVSQKPSSHHLGQTRN